MTRRGLYFSQVQTLFVCLFATDIHLSYTGKYDHLIVRGFEEFGKHSWNPEVGLGTRKLVPRRTLILIRTLNRVPFPLLLCDSLFFLSPYPSFSSQKLTGKSQWIGLKLDRDQEEMVPGK